MCGIVGITGRRPELLARMSAALAHRGPDDEGSLLDDRLSLAHRRLAVLDPSPLGHQPMLHGPLAIVYNGEIYNFREIRAELQALGETFQSQCDTEVLLRAYAVWGPDSLQKMNGMFALAIYDREKQKLFLARDRLGIKPLYYRADGKNFMFASEIKALLPALNTRALDTEALEDYLTYRFVPDDRTLLRGVRRLPPGFHLTIDLSTGRQSLQRYWQIQFSDNRRPIEENAERLRELLRQSVRRRLVSDVPLGAYLSGGLDSSAIVALMAEVSERPIDTYTVTFAGSPLCEAPHARLVAERFGTRHHEIPVEMNAVEVLPEVVRQLDEPIGDAATIPLYLMARETKKHTTVVLSGEGSDELFAGYYKYKVLYASRHLPTLPQIFRSGIPQRLNALFDRNQARKYQNFAAVFTQAERAALLKFTPNAGARFDPGPYFNTGHPLHNLLNLDIATWLPNDLFVKGDKMTMTHGVEARVPFMDHQLAEFAATIPPAQKLAWGRDKRVYRQAVAPLLPPEIVNRKKQGFTIPLNQWLSEGLEDYAQDLFRSADIPEINTALLPQIIRSAPQNTFTRRKFWTLLFLVAWHREVMI